MERSYFAIIPANIRYDKELCPNAKLLYGEITALTSEKGFCWASNQYFSELYDVDKKSISRWISSLEKKGYIKCELIYKENSKEILQRKIYLVNLYQKSDVTLPTELSIPMDKKVDTYGQKSPDTQDKIVPTPMDKNVEDNNTLFNNTINNTEDIDFDWFWNLYDKKEDKKTCKEKFVKLTKTERLAIKKHLPLYIKKTSDKTFRKNPLTYLNQKTFLDEIEDIKVGFESQSNKIATQKAFVPQDIPRKRDGTPL